MFDSIQRFCAVVILNTVVALSASAALAADPVPPKAKPAAQVPAKPTTAQKPGAQKPGVQKPGTQKPGAPVRPAANGRIARLVRSPVGQQLAELKLTTEGLKVGTEVKDGSEMDFVFVEGQFLKPGWGLLLSAKMKINRSPTGKFKIKAKVTGKTTLLAFTAVGPKGEVVKENVTVAYAGWKARDGGPVSKHFFLPSLGFTNISYTQDFVGTNSAIGSNQTYNTEYSAKAVTAKIQYTYALAPPRWDLGASVFMTAMTLSSTLTSNDLDVNSTEQLRFLGLNVRVGYALPFFSEPWRVSLMPGVYYTKATSSSDGFGFKDLLGPQLFPVIRRTLGPRSSVGAYFKYAPIQTAESGSQETAFGISYSYRTKGGTVIPISIDYSNLKLNLKETSTSTDDDGNETSITSTSAINSKSISLSIGYSL